MVRSKNKHHLPSDYLKWEDMQRLVNCLIDEGNYKMALFISLSCYTGLRFSDVVTLQYSDIQGGNMVIIEQKTGKEREIALHKDLQEIIKKCTPPNLFDPNALILAHGNSVLTLQNINQVLKTFQKRYNLELSCYSTHSHRKCFGRRVWSNMNKSSEGLILLQKIFSHSSPEITLIYLGIRRQEISAVYMNL